MVVFNSFFHCIFYTENHLFGGMFTRHPFPYLVPFSIRKEGAVDRHGVHHYHERSLRLHSIDHDAVFIPRTRNHVVAVTI